MGLFAFLRPVRPRRTDLATAWTGSSCPKIRFLSVSSRLSSFCVSSCPRRLTGTPERRLNSARTASPSSTMSLLIWELISLNFALLSVTSCAHWERSSMSCCSLEDLKPLLESLNWRPLEVVGASDSTPAPCSASSCLAASICAMRSSSSLRSMMRISSSPLRWSL